MVLLVLVLLALLLSPFASPKSPQASPPPPKLPRRLEHLQIRLLPASSAEQACEGQSHAHALVPYPGCALQSPLLWRRVHGEAQFGDPLLELYPWRETQHDLAQTTIARAVA